MKKHLRCISIAAHHVIAPLLILTALFCVHAPAADEPPSSLKTGNFDRDPGWEGHNNRVVPKTIPMVKKDFGFSATHFAGKAAGEMGGSIQRSTTPAAYAAKEKDPEQTGHFLGIHVGGPTRIGQYFSPSFTTAKGTRDELDEAPVLAQGKVFDWSLLYDPAANGGNGGIRVTLAYTARPAR